MSPINLATTVHFTYPVHLLRGLSYSLTVPSRIPMMWLGNVWDFYDRMRRFKGRRERLGCDDLVGAGLVVDNAQSSRGASRSNDL